MIQGEQVARGYLKFQRNLKGNVGKLSVAKWAMGRLLTHRHSFESFWQKLRRSPSNERGFVFKRENCHRTVHGIAKLKL